MTDVAWLTPGYPWRDQPVGGLFYRTQSQALSDQGWDVTVVCPTPWTPWPLSAIRPHWRHYTNVPRRARDGRVLLSRPRYPNLPGQPSWAMPDRMLAAAAWRARADWAGARLVHGHSVVEGLAAWRVARRAGLPFVLTFHGSDMNSWPDRHPDRLADLRAATGEASAVIAVSAALVDRIRSVTGVTARHLPIGSNVRALGAQTLPRDEARRRLGIPIDRVAVLFVGNLLPAKGVRELADAISGLGDPFVGIFVGTGPEAGYGTRTRVAAVRLDYRGELPHAEVIRFMAAADVLVLPSYSEGLPTVLVEAGALGLPVIASSVGGIPELLGDGRGTLLPDISAEAIRSALATFVGDHDQAKRAADRLREHVLTSYDVQRNTERLIECYRSAIGSRPRPGT